MTIIADTGALYAAFDALDVHHRAVTAYLRGLDDKPLVPALVLAELDHLTLTRQGEEMRSAVMAELAELTQVATFTHDTFAAAADIAARYGDFGLGLTDASIMVAASEYHTLDILTTDQRHFRAVRPIARSRSAYRLVPFDA